MNYKVSDYLFDFVDDGQHIIYSMMTTSFISLDDEKYVALYENRFDVFSDTELDLLYQMGFIYESNKSELDTIMSKRKDAFNNGKNDDLLSLVILPTTKCNARCYYCYECDVAKESMKSETVSAVIDFIKSRAKKVHIKWFGGEPTLEPGIIDYVCQELKNANIEYGTSFVSNGYLFNRDFTEKALDRWNLKSIQITLDAVGTEYDKIKNYVYSDKNSAFDIVIDNIKSLIEHSVYVNIRINYDPERYQKAIEVIDYVSEHIGVSDYLIVYVSSITGEKIKRLIDYYDEDNPQIKLYEHLIDCGYIRDWDFANLYPRLLNCTIHHKNAFVVDVKGKLYKCQHAIINQDADSIGSIDSDSFNTETLEKWSNLDFPYQECKSCKFLPVCLGGCRYYALNNEKFYACYQLKNSFLALIKMLYKKMIKGG